MKRRIACFSAAALVIASGLAANAAPVNSVQGKKISVASDEFPADTSLPVFPATKTVASVLAPTTYKSAKSFLDITTSVLTQCNAGTAAAMVTVGGVTAFPQTAAGIWTEASGAGFKTSGHQWYLLPESLGGLPVAPASSISLIMSTTSDCIYFLPSIVARTGK